MGNKVEAERGKYLSEVSFRMRQDTDCVLLCSSSQMASGEILLFSTESGPVGPFFSVRAELL